MVSNDETVHENTIPVKSLFDIPYLLHVIPSALNHPSPSRFFTTDPELTCTEYIDIIFITYWRLLSSTQYCVYVKVLRFGKILYASITFVFL